MSVMIYGENEYVNPRFQSLLLFNGVGEKNMLQNVMMTCVSESNPTFNTTLIEKNNRTACTYYGRKKYTSFYLNKDFILMEVTYIV